jgi:two-component system sensor histidine kinase TctE
MLETPEARLVMEWWRSPFADSTSQTAPNSLFLEILDWMLAPLLLLWPISIAFTNHYAHQIADQPYDGALIESVMVLSQYVEGLATPQPKRLPRAVQTSLTSDGLDRRFFSVSGIPVSRSVEAVVANELPVPEVNHLAESADEQLLRVTRAALYDINADEIPAPKGKLSTLVFDVRLRDDVVRGEPVRVAYRTIHAPDGLPLLVQVAETRNEREALVSRIIRGVLLPQFAMIPVAVILSYLGLSRGLRPLRRLHHRISVRRPGDLSPLAAESAPEEVRPLLISLNEMMQRLEINLQAQQRFIADAAHQMRTPLTGLKMQAELALEEHDPRRTRRSLQLIADSANRAAHLTNQLLMLARTEASHSKVHRVEPADLRALARAVTIEWAERAMVKELDLAFEGGDWPLMTEGVPLLLREMIYNLVDNAVKYTPHGGKVTVRARSTEFVVLEVEDSGVGIPAEERQQVFERFYRVLGSEESGSGLGLPIVQEIADLHRARVELLESETGGCLFRVSFVRRGGAAAPLDMRPD